ncbi:hypothetical protein V8G54_020027 [Vigna mungo]|uniref:Uncharacterized protein n=1 Tax=Vigna mungo TaxID=3915 RepID=A0AAQ3NCW0_VIGMU
MREILHIKVGNAGTRSERSSRRWCARITIRREGRCSWIWSQGPWTASDLNPTARFSARITSSSDSPAPETTGPRVTILRGAELIDSVLDVVRKEAENCDCLQVLLCASELKSVISDFQLRSEAHTILVTVAEQIEAVEEALAETKAETVYLRHETGTLRQNCEMMRQDIQTILTILKDCNIDNGGVRRDGSESSVNDNAGGTGGGEGQTGAGRTGTLIMTYRQGEVEITIDDVEACLLIWEFGLLEAQNEN